MPLRFHRVYRLDCLTKDYLESPQIAMGVRNAPLVIAGKEKTVIQFMTPNEVNFAHYIDGEIESDGEDEVIVKDTERSEHFPKTVRWKFVPLTLQNWSEMEISGAEEVRKYVGTDADLQRFYQDQWLPDSWVEHPGQQAPPSEEAAEAPQEAAEQEAPEGG